MVFNDCCGTLIKCFKNICGVFNYNSTSDLVKHIYLNWMVQVLMSLLHFKC